MPLSSCQVVLDDARPGHPAQVRFAAPRAIITAHEAADVPDALARIARATQSGHYAAGYFSYELGYALEPRLAPHLPPERGTPLLWFGVFDACEAFDDAAPALRAYAGPLRHEWDEQAYRTRFARAHDLIAAGDLYQINLSFRARFAFAGDPLTLYRGLRSRAGVGHAAFIDDGARQIISLSPELFFELTPDGAITTRPMKGTAARGKDSPSDAAARAGLLASVKDRAENLMIVDLMRNDLGRIAERGSVAVPSLFSVETYPTVHQLVSTVTARLAPHRSVGELVHALFPGGSVTGAPKIRAMDVIAELEDSPRGPYCGAIGFFAPDGAARFNIAIRTLTIAGNRGELGIGGAVTHDSRPGDEYRECLLKALFFEHARRPIELIETLRYSPREGFVRVALHLARMARSAGIFGIAFDAAHARAALDAAVADMTGAMRVRLALAEDGCFTCAATPLDETPSGWRFVVSPRTVAGGDALLQHKTDWRELYDAEQRRAAREQDADEVLFCNERGELTEGSRSSIFVDADGTLLTPPLAAGVLDGCLRRALIAQGRCREAVLRRDDLAGAANIYLGNSLRGLIRAVPAAPRAPAKI